MVAEHNLDLREIPGTGIAGRVTKNDVLGYIDSAGSREAPAAAPSHRHPRRRRAPHPPAQPAMAPTGVEPWEGDRVEPWSRIRKLTAEHMVMSRRVSPHVNTIFEIDYSRVAQLRGQAEEIVRRPRGEPHLPRIHRQDGRGRVAPPPDAQRGGGGRGHHPSARHQSRHRGGAGLGAHRPGHQARRRAGAPRPRPGDQRSGRAGARQEAEPRRGPEGHLHDHQSRVCSAR